MEQLRYEIGRLETLLMYLELPQEKNIEFHLQIRNIREEVDSVEETINSLSLKIEDLEEQ